MLWSRDRANNPIVGQAHCPLELRCSSRSLLRVMIVACLLGVNGFAAAEVSTRTPEEEALGKRTAVALNYCRSAFYRIGRSPTKQVLAEERSKILNNLNLTSLHDEEIVTLYSSVLDEIGSIHIAERERGVVDAGYGKSWQSLATFTAFGVLTDVTDMNYASLVKRGATSWWDFRGMQVNHDMELWKVEKSRMTAIQTKSSNFLDASWKLARKRNLPDRWLLRDGDFDRLEQALLEPDPEIRLRRLARLEPFMECYPPYWYYRGRTQQSLGQFVDAEKTYCRLADVGDGFFRRDEMLAASMANVASIRDYLKMPGARDAAEQALAHTTDSWEVNLAAAMVLMRHNEIALAEDAVLRNLDSNLESEQSGVALLAVYAREGDPKKILARLDDAATVSRTPIPVLLRCAAALKGQRLPVAVAERLQSSLHGYFGGDDFMLVADPSWELRSAMFAVDEATYSRPTIHVTDRAATVQFRRVQQIAVPGMSNEDEFAVLLKYADDFEVKLTMRRDGNARISQSPRYSPVGKLMAFVADRDQPSVGRDVLKVTAVDTAGAHIAFNGLVQPLNLATPVESTPTELANTPAGEPAMSTQPVVTTVSSTSRPSVSLGTPEPLTDLAP